MASNDMNTVSTAAAAADLGFNLEQVEKAVAATLEKMKELNSNLRPSMKIEVKSADCFIHTAGAGRDHGGCQAVIGRWGVQNEYLDEIGVSFDRDPHLETLHVYGGQDVTAMYAFVQSTARGEAFGNYSGTARDTIVIPVQCYVRLMDFFGSDEWTRAREKLDRHVENVRSRRLPIQMSLHESFLGEGDVVYKLPLVFFADFNLELEVRVDSASKRHRAKLRFSNESIGTLHLPIEAVVELANNFSNIRPHLVKDNFAFAVPAIPPVPTTMAAGSQNSADPIPLKLSHLYSQQQQESSDPSSSRIGKRSHSPAGQSSSSRGESRSPARGSSSSSSKRSK